MNLIETICKELNVKKHQVENTLRLLEEDNTVPFIARYRKEATGGLDEEQIEYIDQKYKYLLNLESKKESILKLIEEKGKLTKEIVDDINNATKLSELDDIYRPYKEKKKTRASIAINNGLEPFATKLLQAYVNFDVEKEADKYINENVKDIESVINGSKDIIAEIVSDDPKIRWKTLDSIYRFGYLLTSKKKDAIDEELTYKMYYDRKEKISNLVSHKILAINRAEKEKVINVNFDYNKEYLYTFVFNRLIKNNNEKIINILKEAIVDGMDRLLFPSCEREIRSNLKEKADKRAIDIFSYNLEKLLLQPPLSKKTIMGFDPAYRTGCKLAIIDNTGSLLSISVIYPHKPNQNLSEATRIFVDLIKNYNVDIIAIGNGTASRESLEFVSNTIKDYDLNTSFTIVSEAGASVYSASELARSEFPDLHVEQRSAISIARRLLDPLSELIKIDPKSIGVGQYQHDLLNKELNERLDFVVLKAVNLVGVDVNTASVELLTHVSGLNKSLAKAIVEKRNELKGFKNRNELLKVKRFSSKVFEQSAGFLRIKDGSEVLDMTSIHPESYNIVKDIMKIYNIDKLGQKTDLDVMDVSNKLNIDTFLAKDLIDSINSPLRDYRERYDAPLIRKDVLEISDLKIGDKLVGTVRNVVDFGAFVDVGLHDDGLLHISNMSLNKVSDPYDILSVGDVINVYVSAIENNKLQLSLIKK